VTGNQKPYGENLFSAILQGLNAFRKPSRTAKQFLPTSVIDTNDKPLYAPFPLLPLEAIRPAQKSPNWVKVRGAVSQ